MLKSNSIENRRFVNYHQKIRYQKKIPQNSKVFLKTKSQDKYKNDNSSNEFKSIIKHIYSQFNQKKNIKEDKEDNDNNIILLSPKKRIYCSALHRNERTIKNKKIFPNNNQRNEIGKAKNKLSIKKVKPIKDKEEVVFSPFLDYNNKLMDKFNQISIIRPNKKDIFLEKNSDSDIPNDENAYFYHPNKELKLDSNKREIKNYCENSFTDNKLIRWKEINFAIEKQINEDKNNIKDKDLIEKGEKYDKLVYEYNVLLKELNELKNKITISSGSIKSEEKKIQHLEDINIIINNTHEKETIKRKKQKIKKVKKKRMKSLTSNIRYSSSSEETKTRDNSKNGVCTTLLNEFAKKKCAPNIMIISKENELNLTASYSKIETNDTNDTTITNKPKKKIKKINKKNNNKDNNWNTSNKIMSNIIVNYIGISNNASINNIKKNKTERNTIKKRKKRILKKKEISKERNRTKSNSSCRKIRKLNVPIINIKNETFSYNIKTKYFRFNAETKSVDYKYNADRNKNNINQNKINTKQLSNNRRLFHNHSKSMSIDKNKKHKIFDDDIIIKNINLNIINQFNNNNQAKNHKFENKNNNNNIKEYNDYKDKNAIIDKKENGEDKNGNISENKEFSYFSKILKDNNNCLSEDEKHKKGISIINNDNKSKNENKEKKYTFKIRIVKYRTKKKNKNNYFDILFKDLINKILVKRTLKKWFKLSKK